MRLDLFGFFLLFLCCLASVYGAIASLLAAKLKHRRLFRSAQMASATAMVLCIGASVILWILLFSRDYSVGYVYRNSSADLPLRYTFSAFWCALEGSHLLWTLLLSIFSGIAHFTYSRDNEHMMPYVSLTLQSVLAWMFYLTISTSDPFAPMMPAPEEGLGMNALLQNGYMIIHPPILFTGYTSCTLPFAYAIGALCYGEVTAGWLKTVRQWSLVAWTALTVGVILGGRWAYVELGWAGYWAWDPVENSSLMPWLFITALLHSLLVQDKIGHLKRLSIVLAILAFFFSFFGTFITRSGVISSVHSFAQSSVGPNYLAFLCTLLGASVLLYAWRAPSILPTNTEKIWGVSRESALVVTQFLLGIFAIIVFIGTMYPILSEVITGSKFNVQAPYFNTFAPYIGFGFIVAIVFGNILRYQAQKFTGSRIVLHSAIGALIPTGLFCWYGNIFASRGYAFAVQVVGVALVFWGLIALTIELVAFVRQTRAGAWQLLSRHSAYFGAYIAHLGVLIAILGFLGNYRGMDKTQTVKPGDSIELYGYKFTFHGLKFDKVENTEMISAPLTMTRDGRDEGMIHPARSKYPTKEELFNEIGLVSSFWHDIYAVLADFQPDAKDQQATIQMHINPTVRFVWFAAVLFLVGGLLCLADRFRGRHRRLETQPLMER